MAIDGRNSRWDEHRTTRRAELVSHTLRAIRVHGPGVGMDEIAARAGTSKTVLYRHFGDRAGLYDAVVDSVHQYIRDGVLQALEDSSPQDMVHFTTTLANAYLSLVERDRDIYLFVMSGAGGTTPNTAAGRVPVTIASAVTDLLHERVPDITASRAQTWGYGLVGFIQAAVDSWMDSDPRPPREEVVGHICAMFSPALAGAVVVSAPHSPER
ncbi:TetR/AcrR family transcriptional regulator [Demequina sp. B12]|uniref:TetR/AcrR family transcriptional regulator n=1 Tax=Demequina sp. B12 TaxID=2992757 RepID=UPI00237A4339|nr:TetR/AcrR family transcriptional regulator [Demequina sp. B12]MDE0573131.1 TetR/AcrR family transcriptional regulator [Demequina sp. B12]